MKIVRRGFTVVEIMVAIAIILVIAAITLPVLSSARASSQRSACSAQLRQVFAAIAMYAEDHSGMTSPPLFLAATFPYARDKTVFKCPVSTMTPEFAGKYRGDVLDFGAKWPTADYPISYAYIRFAEPADQLRVWQKLLESRQVGIVACPWHGSVTDARSSSPVKPRNGPIPRVCFDGHIYTLPKRKDENTITVVDLFYNPENILQYVL